MKNLAKYIVWGSALALFMYLDYLGKDQYASQLFGALMWVFGMIFGLDSREESKDTPTPLKTLSKDEIDDIL